MKILVISFLLLLIPIAYEYAHAWTFCAAGDITSQAVVTAVKNQNCEVDVLLGDYYGKESTFVKGFQEPNVVVLAACGNHDSCSKVLSNDGQKFSSYPIGYTHKNIGFLILNTEDSITKQKSKAETILKSFQNNSSIDGIIIAQHKAAITNPSAHHKESEAKGYREQFVLWKNQFPKFTMLLQGHNHGYQVCNPNNPKITVITEGTGGRDPYPWGSKMDDNCHDNLSGKQYTGFTLFNVTDQGIGYKHVSIK